MLRLFAFLSFFLLCSVAVVPLSGLATSIGAEKERCLPEPSEENLPIEDDSEEGFSIDEFDEKMASRASSEGFWMALSAAFRRSLRKTVAPCDERFVSELYARTLEQPPEAPRG